MSKKSPGGTSSRQSAKPQSIRRPSPSVSKRPKSQLRRRQAENVSFTIEFSDRDAQGRLSKDPQRLTQDKEWCVVRSKRRIRFHDYHEIYKIPGLYEHLFYHNLQCVSPDVVGRDLKREVEKTGQSMASLNVLDIGAGNGMVGERLIQLGAGAVTGIDIIEEARQALYRDRPNLYRDYFVMDLTEIPEPVRLNLEAGHFNCLVTVAALGFGDIPVAAFSNAYNLIVNEGWIAFNIKVDFLTQQDYTGFSGLIRRMIDTGMLELKHRKKYRHRLATDGTPLHYLSMIGVKKANVPYDWFEDVTEPELIAE